MIAWLAAWALAQEPVDDVRERAAVVDDQATAIEHAFGRLSWGLPGRTPPRQMWRTLGPWLEDRIMAARVAGDEVATDALCRHGPDRFPGFDAGRLCTMHFDPSIRVDLGLVDWIDVATGGPSSRPPPVLRGVTMLVLWTGRCGGCDTLDRVGAIADMFEREGLSVISLTERTEGFARDPRKAVDLALSYHGAALFAGPLGVAPPTVWEQVRGFTRGGVYWVVLLVDDRPVYSVNSLALEAGHVAAVLDAVR